MRTIDPTPSAPIAIAAAAPPKRDRRQRAHLVLHAVFGVIGVGALALLIRSVGPLRLLEILGRLSRWLPVLVGLDVLRIGCEALGTSLLARPFGRIARGSLARIHLLAFAVGSIMPAGRAASEAVKASLLSPALGAPRALAIAATNQALALLSGALIALPCAAVAYQRTGLAPLTGALALYALTAGGGFTLVQLAGRGRPLGGLFARCFARLRAATASFHDAFAAIPVLPAGPLLLMVGSRALHTLEFGLLLYAVGAAFGVGPALLGQGVNLLGGSVGDLIPGQFGATDAAFALAAPALDISAASAVSVSVITHCVQLFWALVGAVVPLFVRERSAGEGAARALFRWSRDPARAHDESAPGSGACSG